MILTEELRTLPVSVCPKCGNKYFTMSCESTLEFLSNGSTRVTQRDPLHKSDKKRRREHFVGIEANEHGKPMIKERLIDRDANIYYEYVKDPATGEVTRQVLQQLTEHKGRGSAKKK